MHYTLIAHNCYLIQFAVRKYPVLQIYEELDRKVVGTAELCCENVSLLKAYNLSISHLLYIPIAEYITIYYQNMYKNK